MPAVTGGIGVCHTYVDQAADLDKAADIVFNAKVTTPLHLQRPGHGAATL